MAGVLQAVFSNVYPLIKINFIFIKKLLNFVPTGPMGNKSSVVQVMIWCNINGSGNGLTHWGRVMHICISKLTIIGSDNGLLPGRRQAIIWTNGGILLIGSLGTNFSEILIEIQTFSFKKMQLKMSSGK